MKVFAKIALIAAILPSMAIAGGLFPSNPVPMSEGYGRDGAGTHFAEPSGIPGSDCVVNPVSFKWHLKTVTEAKVVDVKTIVPGDTFSIPAKVLFDFDKDVLRDEGKVALNELAEKFRDTGLRAAAVIGHTDSMGTDEYNLELGHRRAKVVREYLKTVLSPEVDLIAISRGESEPLVPNTFADGRDDPAGRQQNRRVDLKVYEVDQVVVTQEEVVATTEIVAPRNPQVFHVLASGNQVYCGADQVVRPNMLFWNNSWRNGSRW